MAADNTANMIYLKDYQVPAFLIENTELDFDLYEDHALVKAELNLYRNPESTQQQAPLVLDGIELELVEVAIDGVALADDAYVVDSESLTIADVPERFVLSTTTVIKPAENTSLEGLYQSQKMFCTQCEAEGFRKITYYLDRPDVMSVFTTSVSADKTKYPVLLSNGNEVAREELANGRHKVTWLDPHKKPCYLFALVAGDLVTLDDSFTTLSGRDVTLRIFVEPKDLDKCDHAMASLKASMRWDEEVYGREYDLDIFMIVAVDDFNMGAMENKGLNIFNTSCVLANPKTTTDMGFQRVEAVVAHEYFHNWSGNRVTCRDWFQLSLKEGFTVFRDACFSADMNSATVKRVEDVSLLRTMQFAEDAGPMAHPIRPASFIEISNFYTLTIYEKGAEVVGMLHTLLGADDFRKGSDLYFERHDGQAVTCDDFVAAMADASGKDLSQFKHWYSQAGTPVLAVSDSYDADSGSYTLHIKQSAPTTPEASSEEKAPLLIPFKLALLGDAGQLKLQLKDSAVDVESSDNTEMVLALDKAEQSFTFTGLPEKPVPSLLRGFSAPVNLHFDYSQADLLRLMQADSDGFVRWDACQKLAQEQIKRQQQAYRDNRETAVDSGFIEAIKVLISDSSLDKAMVAHMLQLPSEAYLAQLSEVIDVAAIHHGRKAVRKQVAQQLAAQFKALYQANQSQQPYSPAAEQVAQRSLKNIALAYWLASADAEALAACYQQYLDADNMTDQMAALSLLVNTEGDAAQAYAQQALDAFYQQWQDEALVVNQWFQVQSSCQLPNALAKVESLMRHPAFEFKNPNKLRAVIGGFCTNAINFHSEDGAGYKFLADQIIKLDQANPQIASRLLTPLTRWRKYPQAASDLMRAQLERIKAQDNLSKDVFEVVSKSL